jgi:NADH-quinone oxidoreductase subunit F
VAVVGSGPAGLTAAHYLSLKGVKVTLFEAEEKPGGMLYCAIPPYRLPREVIEKEIESLLNDNIKIKRNARFGRDFTVDGLFKDGFKAILLSIGAHKSKRLRLRNEDLEGVIPSIEFLKAFNMKDKQLAKGRVGVIGGGNSAIDSARTALRLKEVESVTILYRRTRNEMPAFAEEIEAAEQEGITIQTLVTPIQVLAENGRLEGVECIQNDLGDADASGRRRPIAVEGSEHRIELDTLIVAIGEDSGIDAVSPSMSSGIGITRKNTVDVDMATMLTNRPGVFGAGDVVRGPNTVVDAIADGKKSAVMIERYLKREELLRPSGPRLPRIYIEPPKIDGDEEPSAERAQVPRAPADWRKRNFVEVEVSLTPEEALSEAGRCMRCDLEFTAPKEEETKESETRRQTA